MRALRQSSGLLIAALWLCLIPVPGGAAWAQASQFKGWSAVWKELSARVAPREAPLEGDDFLPAEDMEDLLGTWSTFGSEHHFRNGYPNSLSMMIWQVVMSSFAESMGRSCTKPELEFTPTFLATLATVCTWPKSASQSDKSLRSYWLAIMGFNAPEPEYAAWRDFIRREYAAKPAAEAVRAMTLAITLHPNFLLHR